MRKKRASDVVLKICVLASAGLTVLLAAGLIAYIIVNGAGALGYDFFFGKGGIMPMVVSTLIMVLLTTLISAPVGVFAAVYLNEYAKKNKFMGVLRFCIQSLAGIPSIIYGLFGMLFFVTFLQMGFSLFAGCLTLAIMVLPVIITNTEEALKAAPSSYREGSLALGASKVRTIFLVVLPSAAPGILTGIILSIGRMVGESAAVYLTAGMVAKMPSSVMSSGRTLAVHMYLLAKEGLEFEKAFGTALVLVVLVVLINFFANFTVSKLSKN